jgi:hypothetical protein
MADAAFCAPLRPEQARALKDSVSIKIGRLVMEIDLHTHSAERFYDMRLIGQQQRRRAR